MMNEMRDRLVELLVKDDIFDECECGMCTRDNYCVRCGSEILADHLIENGVIVLPCKIGDVCYPLPRYKTPIVERTISRIILSKAHIIVGYYENDGQYRPPLRTRTLGEDVFLTKEQAEQKLKEMRGVE